MKMTQINLRALKAIAFATSDEKPRYYLKGVFVQAEPEHVTYVATNGRILLAHREINVVPNDVLGQWIIPLEICNGFKLTSLPTIDTGILSAVEQKLQLNQIATDTIRVFNPIDGTFPDWVRVVPREIKEPRIATFDPAELMRLQKAGALLSGERKLKYDMTQNGDGPALISWDALPNTFGVIMPIGADNAKLPAWFGQDSDKTSQAQLAKFWEPPIVNSEKRSADPCAN